MNENITYLWIQQRKYFIEVHNFIYQEAQKRILNQFANIEDEAQEAQNNYLTQYSSNTYYEEIDTCSIFENAFEAGYKHYDLLSNMKVQVQLNTISLIFHHWNITLRDWLAKELKHNFEEKYSDEIAYSPDMRKIYQVFNELGWQIESQPFFKKLDAMRLIVNIYKHGNGRSLKYLQKNYPEYLNKKEIDIDFLAPLLHHSDLKINEAHLDEFSEAIIAFWQKIPERLYIKKEA